MAGALRVPDTSDDNRVDQIAADLAGCSRGDRAALQRIFAAEAAGMTGVAMRILGRQELAEEAVQDCFVTIWQKADDYHPELGSGRAWAYMILRHRALTILRDGRREDLMDPQAEGVQLASKASSLPVWQQAYSRLDDGGQLKRCLSELENDKRDAVLMAFVSGYCHGEIAARLILPLGTAKARIKRGLSSLRASLS